MVVWGLAEMRGLKSSFFYPKTLLGNNELPQKDSTTIVNLKKNIFSVILRKILMAFLPFYEKDSSETVKDEEISLEVEAHVAPRPEKGTGNPV